MAYLTIARIAGEPDELLDKYQRSTQTMSNVGRDHNLILHAAARTEAGLLMINLWRSKQDSEAAAADSRRNRALSESGVAPEKIHREHYEVAEHVVFARE
jgi:type IV pilus biogenesis protein CpaD/CtpE